MLRFYAIVGAAVAAIATLGWSHTAAYRAGRVAAQLAFTDKINTENHNAGIAAEKWRADLRRCNAAGGVFDFEAGACDQ